MNKIVIKEEAIDIIKSDYSTEELEVIFAYHTDHPIEICDGKLRWVKTIDYENDPNILNPNEMAIAHYEGKYTQKEYMEYNRQIGYSLYGFWEVFYFNDRFDWDKWNKDKSAERDNDIKSILDEANIESK
jgi:hypothetical protein